MARNGKHRLLRLLIGPGWDNRAHQRPARPSAAPMPSVAQSTRGPDPQWTQSPVPGPYYPPPGSRPPQPFASPAVPPPQAPRYMPSRSVRPPRGPAPPLPGQAGGPALSGPPEADAPAVSWDVLARPPRESAWHRARRILALAVGAVVVVAGVVAIADRVVGWIGSSGHAAPSSTVVSDSDLGGFAATVATDYLSWDPGDRERRRAALARHTTPAVPVDGWNGDGRQWADSPAVVGIARADAHRAVVTVRIRTTPYAPVNNPSSEPPASSAPPPPATGAPERTGDPASASGLDSPAWRPASARWLALAVPVGWVDRRLVVTQRPALVGAPIVDLPAGADPGSVPLEDSASRSTRDVVSKMLAAYATGELEFIRAAGSTVAGLNHAAELAQVSSWALLPGGSADTRLGVATVSWRLSGGAGTLACIYLLRLREQEGRWYLAGLSVPVDGTPR